MLVLRYITKLQWRLRRVCAGCHGRGTFPSLLVCCFGCPVLAIECAASSVALDVQLEDDRVMDQTVDGGDQHCLVGENFMPVGKSLIGADQKRAAFVAGADQFEQNAGLGMILVNIGEVVQYKKIVLVELADGCFKLQ